MGILNDLLTGAITRPGIKVIDSKAVVFEGFDAMRQNPDVVNEALPKPGPVNFTNWGLDENGRPVCIDYPEGVDEE
ncbi:MAG: hypothetical protein J5614_05740 [Paludibacteraceae bacterium]|nr:hypothetical protein [Paludibacteraceae bacterium]